VNPREVVYILRILRSNSFSDETGIQIFWLTRFRDRATTLSILNPSSLVLDAKLVTAGRKRGASSSGKKDDGPSRTSTSKLSRTSVEA
jgi:hypothetical protein